MTDDLMKKLAGIRLAVFDVDGVMTDGGIYMGESGETKRFNILDGLGLKLIARCGVRIVWITARSSVAVDRRARELGIEDYHQGVKDKLARLRSLCEESGIAREQVLYMGDDLHDLKCLQWSGVSIAPGNASRDVRSRVDLVLETAGGHGAVRELAEMIIDAKGTRAEILSPFLLDE